MISKRTTFKVESIEVLDTSMMKLASFDIPQGETYDPDFLYIKVRAVSAGEYYGDNKNGDWFPEQELIKCYKTFLTGHVFKDHQNKSAASAIGEVLSAVWDDDMKCVVLILKIDRKIAPTVARSIEKGYMTDVSMGCRVPYSICSICGHKAKNPKEYCKHIQLLRRKILPDGRKVYEININPKFHDISIVLNGAEKVAKITDIYDANSTEKPKAVITPIQKIADDTEIETGMQKVASHQDLIDNAFELPMADSMQKHADTEKRADFYKKLQGDIINTSKSEIMENRGLEPARILLKAAFTPYWSAMDIEKIALKIKALAVQTGKSKLSVFTGFLNVLDFAGIELAPSEFGNLVAAVFNCKCPIETRTGNIVSAIKETEEEAENNPMKDFGLSKALSIIKSLPSSGMTEGMTIIRKAVPVTDDNSIHDSIMDNIVRPMIPLRSVHTAPLVKRIRIMIKPRMTQPAVFGRLNPLFAQLYSMYQGDRARRLADGITEAGVNKFAAYFSADNSFEKVAKYGTIKALTIGTPIIYGYSKYQRARIDNGEDISSPNRFVAEYPEAVAGLNVLLAPKAFKAVSKNIKKIKKSGVIEKAVNSAKDTVSNAAEKFKKHAGVAEDLMFLDQNGYNDTVDNVLNKIGATRDDLNTYVAYKVAEQSEVLESAIEKRADEFRNDDNLVSSSDSFIDTMAIAKILTEKL